MNRAASESQQPSARDQRGLIFAAVAGFFFFITLIKFGNPVILDSDVVVPHTFFEWFYQPWPVRWGYFGLIGLTAVGLFHFPSSIFHSRSSDVPRSLKLCLCLPLIWFLWQCLSATQTVDTNLTAITLKHFAACIVCFYLGFFILGRLKNPWPLWLFLSLALLWIVREGWNQRFGGLEETRKYFYSLPDWKSAPPEFIKKLSSNRIYSTLFYPNTLAGALLLLTPITLGFAWQLTSKLRNRARWAVLFLIAAPALACLYWSGSKAGWLIALILAAVALVQSAIPKRLKITIIAIIFLVGLAGFAVRYAHFFERGSTSVVARFDYWKAALTIGKEHPIVGTGPGTFAIGYGKLKSPDAEMARLVHNDYLEQLSDSGLLGFAAFLMFVLLFFKLLYRYRSNTCSFAAIGVFGVFIHLTVEFHLYIPAVAWPTFFVMGWLVTRASQGNCNFSKG